MKAIVIGLLAALVSTSALAQAPRTSAEEGRVKGSQMSREKLDAWVAKKRQCYVSARLVEGTHFRYVEGSRKFQVNSIVHLGGFDSAAVDQCDAL